MDALDITRVLLRRWYVVVPLLVLTLFAVMKADDGIAPEYQASASVLLLGPSEPQGGTDGRGGINPYRAAGLDTTAAALAVVANGTPARQAIVEKGLDPAYEVVLTRGAPIMEIRVASDGSKRAVGTVRAVQAALEVDLLTRQDIARAPSSQRLVLRELAPASLAATVVPGSKKVQAVALAVGVTVALSTGLASDALLARRGRRATGSRVSNPEAHANPLRGRHAEGSPGPVGPSRNQAPPASADRPVVAINSHRHDREVTVSPQGKARVGGSHARTGADGTSGGP